MKVLVVGGGGREHALAWKLAGSALVEHVFVAPGNAGTAAENKVSNVAIGADDIDELIAFADAEAIDLTVIGPEQPLVAGIADRFEDAGKMCFGPKQSAARLEGSKKFTKEFLTRHSIPTAAYESFTELEPALRYLRGRDVPIVVKADGLAAGKGVVVAQTPAQAEEAVRSMLEEAAFGTAGQSVVIEEHLSGEEASFIAVVDGRRILPMASSQDHKTRDDGDTGPNTGGMGAYSPAPVVDKGLHLRIMDEIMLPTVNALADEGIEYRGFLYAGVMIDAEGNPKVLEFNCRFGDPETQPILFRLRSDLAEICLSAFDGTLGNTHMQWDPRTSVGIVMASAGYPGSYEKGKTIRGLEDIDSGNVKVFHAGTKRQNGAVLTDGGRVLCVVALGDTVSQARRSAYAAIDRISWDGAFWRRDIGHRAVAREKAGEA